MRRVRGQATVELALGSLVFVTVLIFGIHFAEIGILRLRVQQAAHSAMWDTTALRMHHYQGSNSNFDEAVDAKDDLNRKPATRAEALYGDFDGLAEGGATTLSQVFTRVGDLNVQCRSTAVGVMNFARPGFDELTEAFHYPSNGGNPVDGMACTASARIFATDRVPDRFAERSSGTGFFGQAHPKLAGGLTVCAVGRPVGGSCQGAIPMAYDDWGLSGSGNGNGEELAECDFNCWNPTGPRSGNQAYRKLVERVYEDYQNNKGTTDPIIRDSIINLFSNAPYVFVPSLGNTPTNERDFRFVFSGEGTPGQRDHFSYLTREMDAADMTQARLYNWAVTPYAGEYKKAYQRRGQCFLGSDCSRPVFAKDDWQ